MKQDNPAFPNVVKQDNGTTDYFYGVTKFEYFYAAALTGICANPQLAAHAIQAEQQAKNIIGSEVNVPLTLAKQAHAIATASMQLLDNESKTGF